MPLVNTGIGVVHLELAHSEKKKGYIYAKISIVTTILNVNYTKPKLPPFLNSNPGNGFVDVAKFVPYNDLVKDLPYWLLSSVELRKMTRINSHFDSHNCKFSFNYILT